MQDTGTKYADSEWVNYKRDGDRNQDAEKVHYLSGRQIAAPTKPLYLSGDLNCAHNEIDLAHPATNRMSAGFTDEERADFSALLDTGFTDTFRAAFPDTPDRYTWWSYRTKARERNIGWRIDYWLASRGSVWTSPQIHDDVPGSDHCPVSLQI